MTCTWPPPAAATAAASAFSLTNISTAPDPPKMYTTGPFGGFLRSCASVYDTCTKSSLGMRMKCASGTTVKSPCSAALWTRSRNSPPSTAAARSTRGLRWRKPRAKGPRTLRACEGRVCTRPLCPASVMSSQDVPGEPRQWQAERQVDDPQGLTERVRGDERVAEGHVEERHRVGDPADELLVGRVHGQAGLLARLPARLLPALPARHHDQARGVVDPPRRPVEVDVVPEAHGEHAGVEAQPHLAREAEDREVDVVAAPGGERDVPAAPEVAEVCLLY